MASDGTDFKDTTSAGSFQVSYADTGVRQLVKVRDNKSIESPIDTIHLSVFEKLYTVSYDGNGSTGGSVPLDNNKYGQGQSVEVLENTGALIKTGYTLSGGILRQMTAAQGTCQAQFHHGTSTVTLYAQWEVSRTYAIIYNGTATPAARSRPTRLITLWDRVSPLAATREHCQVRFYLCRLEHAGNGSGIDYAQALHLQWVQTT